MSTPEFILLQLRPLNSPDLNDYSMWGILQDRMYKTRITDLKQQLRTKKAKLYHVVIVAAIRQWSRPVVDI